MYGYINYQNKTFPVSKIAESQEYVSVNPMKKGTTRKGIRMLLALVTSYSRWIKHFSKKDQANKP